VVGCVSEVRQAAQVVPLRKRSKKKEAEYRLRRPFVADMLDRFPWCYACKVFAGHDGVAIFTQNRACDVHELVRRSQGGSILDEDNCVTVCRPCHTRIGNYPQLAFDLGLAKHGWERDS
jgi:hypothetical protein